VIFLSLSLCSLCLSCGLQKALNDMTNQVKNLTMKCNPDGLECSSFICNVFHEDKPDKKFFSIAGFWHCKDSKEVFEIHYEGDSATANKKFNVNTKQQLSTIVDDNQIKLSVDVLFTNEGNGMKNLSMNFNLNLLNNSKVSIAEKFSLEPEMLAMVCNCKGINALENEMTTGFSLIKSEKTFCWGLTEDCLSPYCVGTIEKPYLMHFSFNGSMSCPNKLPDYRLTLFIHHPNSKFMNQTTFLVNKTEPDIELKHEIAEHVLLNLNTKSYFTKITKESIILLNTISAKISGKYKADATQNITVSFPNHGCTPTETITTAKPSTTKATTKAPATTVATNKAPATTAATTKASATTAATTKAPDTIAATTKAPDTTAATTKAPDTTAATTKAPDTTAATTKAPGTTAATTEATDTTPVKTTSGKGTGDGKTSDKKPSASPAKVALIILAVLIILTVFLVGLYLKKKRRLSSQPAYYNDIALNDPLRYEMDEEQGDDDELPLFT